MSSCNCTSNIEIINVDTVYDMSSMIWKCEVHIWTYGCMACLYDIKALFIIILNASSFKIHQVIFMYRISLSDNKHLQKLPRCRKGWGHFLSRALLKFRMAVSENPYSTVKRRARALTSSITCNANI